MCTIIGNYKNENTFTGYKVVIVDKYNHYYSPFTGIRYQVGDIIPPKDVNKLKSKYRYSSQSVKFEEDMKGYTGVFMSKEAAEKLLGALNALNWGTFNFTLKIIKMTIAGELKLAEMKIYSGTHQTVIGKKITKITKIK